VVVAAAISLTYLTHVRDIEHGSLAVGTTPQVFLHHSTILSLVQDWQFISCKGNHIST
jgi:hypothetical protein